MKVKHPAKFSDTILPVLAQHLKPWWTVLDPFAGTGRVHELPGRTWGIEIEPEWASVHPATVVGNALYLPFRSGVFDAVVTSPTYGNRFSDKHNAQDGSVRRSYTHDLRAMTGDPDRKLHPDNSGGLPWGPKYWAFHERAYAEILRVLKPGGRFLLNVSDFFKNKKLVEAVDWHTKTVLSLGFVLDMDPVEVGTPRLKYGANAERAPHEVVLVLRKAA